MKNATKKSGPFLFSALVTLSILFLYTAYDKEAETLNFKNLAAVLIVVDRDRTLCELNKVSALAGIGLLSTAMGIGPLAACFPSIFRRRLWWRRYLGLTGFAFVLAHLLYAVTIHYRLSATMMFADNPKIWGVITALFAFAVFLAMAATSNSASIRTLGAGRWKTLHRCGYVALTLSGLHFIIMETKADGRLAAKPYGWVFLCLPFAVVLLKLVTVLRARAQRPPGKSSSSI